MQTIHENITRAIKQYKDEYEVNDITKENRDIFEVWRDISWKLDENDIKVQFTPVYQDSDSYVMCTYHISKIGGSIVLDWDTECYFDNEKEMIDKIIRLEMRGREIESTIYGGEDYDILARENKAMASALLKLGYTNEQISDICNGAI